MVRLVWGRWSILIENPKLLVLNIITTWVALFLWACDLLPKWWYNLMYLLGGGGTYYLH